MGQGWNVLRWLGVHEEPQEREVLDAVAAALDRLDPALARYVAAFAFTLGRVASVDLHVRDEERQVMTRLVAREGALSEVEAETVVTLALGEHRHFGSSYNLHVTRELDAVMTHEERLGLLRCLFAVSAADASVSVREDNEVRQISRELRLEHADFVRARAEVREHLAVLRRADAL